MHQARYKYAVAELNGNIYVAGGRAASYSTLSLCTVECYYPRSDTWFQMPDMNYRRESFALVGMEHYLYALGFDRTVERYDEKCNTWTVVRAYSLMLSIYRLLIILFFIIQLGVFDGSPSISRGIGVFGEIYVLMGKREFAKFKPDLECSLVPLRSTSHSCEDAYSLFAN